VSEIPMKAWLAHEALREDYFHSHAAAEAAEASPSPASRPHVAIAPAFARRSFLIMPPLGCSAGNSRCGPPRRGGRIVVSS